MPDEFATDVNIQIIGAATRGREQTRSHARVGRGTRTEFG